MQSIRDTFTLSSNLLSFEKIGKVGLVSLRSLHVRSRVYVGPIIVKGILTVEDALRAAEMKMDGIVVSNHGGRQIDGSVSALSALDKITSDPRMKDSALTILFDSGIRTGVDMLKALALGQSALSTY